MTAPLCLSPVDEELASVAHLVGGYKPRRLEFSIRLAPGRIDHSGRFCCWLQGGTKEAGEAALGLLRRRRAPAEVQLAARAGSIAAHGLAVEVGADGADYRYYRHSRCSDTQADRYHAWRWSAARKLELHLYSFHFAPETAAGERPEDFVPAGLRDAVAGLADEPRIAAASGFWLRRPAAGPVDQVDIAMPGNRELGGLLEAGGLDRMLELPDKLLAPWRDLPVRHLAVGSSGAVTAYVSANLGDAWPAGEAALQGEVRAAAARDRASADAFYGRLPPPPEAGPAGADLDAFYGGDVATWRKVLGPGMHYHAGLFTARDSLLPDEAEMEAGLERAVRELYPFIPARGRVYDIGCGWGGPLAMINRELGCRGLGLTVSRAQFRYVAGRGIPVRLGDADDTLPPGRFDCALLLESLCHVRDKSRLLERLRPFAGRLVMRVNCQDASARAEAFGGTMHMVSSMDLRRIIEEAGWRVIEWRDRRPEALPSINGWLRRLDRLGPTGDRHLETLRAWCRRTAGILEPWGRNNPLIEVVAD